MSYFKLMRPQPVGLFEFESIKSRHSSVVKLAFIINAFQFFAFNL